MKNIKPGLFTLLVILMSLSSRSQTVLFERNTDDFSIVGKYGKNLKNYFHMYTGLNFHLPDTTSGRNVVMPLSYQFQLGGRYKLKVSKFYAIGIEATYKFANYRFKSENFDPDLADKIFIIQKFNSIGLGFYNRFNVGRRGNQIGNFLDIGINTDLNFYSRLKTVQVVDKVKKKLKEDYPDHVDPLHFNGFVRIGRNRHVVFFNYNLNELIISNPGSHLPAYSIGYEIGLY